MQELIVIGVVTVLDSANVAANEHVSADMNNVCVCACHRWCGRRQADGMFSYLSHGVIIEQLIVCVDVELRVIYMSKMNYSIIGTKLSV